MKLYKTTYATSIIDQDGRRVRKSTWQGSAADASKERTRLKGLDRSSEPSTVDVEIPGVKQGLLMFLNTLTN